MAGDDAMTVLRWLQFLFGKDLRETWRDVRDWIAPKCRIDSETESFNLPELLIIGPGGVGKSTLGQFLTGDFRHAAERAGRYEESLSTENYRLENPLAAVFIPPGQKHRRDLSWTEIESGLAAGRFTGIMLVMSYGYHSIGDRSVSGLSGPAVATENWLDNHLQVCRKDELQVVQRLLPFAARSPRKMWLLTVVTKQDLWGDREADVRSHYTQGDYGKAVSKLYDRQAKGLQAEVAFTCLITQNFQTGRGELLQKTIAGYDQSRYNEAVRDLLSKLAAIRHWELDQ